MKYREKISEIRSKLINKNMSKEEVCFVVGDMMEYILKFLDNEITYSSYIQKEKEILKEANLLKRFREKNEEIIPTKIICEFPNEKIEYETYNAKIHIEDDYDKSELCMNISPKVPYPKKLTIEADVMEWRCLKK